MFYTKVGGDACIPDLMRIAYIQVPCCMYTFGKAF